MPPLALAGIGMATSLIGGGISAASAGEAGANAEALGKYEQAQYLQEADTSVARAQRKMEEQRRRTTLVQSTLAARGAGAGIDPSMGSTSVLSQQIAQRGEYSALNDLAQGQDLAAGYTNMGLAAEYQGQLAESQVPLQQFGDIAGGASSAFGTLGRFTQSSAAAPGGFAFG